MFKPVPFDVFSFCTERGNEKKKQNLSLSFPWLTLSCRPLSYFLSPFQAEDTQFNHLLSENRFIPLSEHFIAFFFLSSDLLHFYIPSEERDKNYGMLQTQMHHTPIQRHQDVFFLVFNSFPNNT